MGAPLTTPARPDVDPEVREWHDQEGHCNHSCPSVQVEPSCCVCDAQDPCDRAKAEARLLMHDCTENVDTDSWRCEICGEQFSPQDLLCPGCNRFPCYCDEAYERARDERMGL